METVAAMLSVVLGLPPDFDVSTLQCNLECKTTIHIRRIVISEYYNSDRETDSIKCKIISFCESLVDIDICKAFMAFSHCVILNILRTGESVLIRNRLRDGAR